VFCAIIAGHAPATVIRTWPDTIAISPRHPVTPGHILVIPRAHVTDVGQDAAVAATTMARAAELAAALPAANVITSRGTAATQSVFHLHLHVVPRTETDGLPLPWTPQHAARATAAQGSRA
jgi:histidine triad (HIT) family protein